jgi:copper(I)-binding protein
MIKRRDLLGRSMMLATTAVMTLLVGVGVAHEYEVGKIKVEHPWLRAPQDGDNKAQFFAVIENNGDTPDKLIAVKSEKFGKAAIFGDGKNPSAETPVTIAPKQKVTLAPGGAYVGLLDIKKHLEVGWGLEMTLVFEKAGEVVIDAAIDAPDAKHAHDAEAMERWEKAHGKDNAGPKTEGHEGHEGHGGHDGHEGHMMHEHHHQEPAPAPAQPH